MRGEDFMKKRIIYVCSLVLTLLMLVGLASCGRKSPGEDTGELPDTIETVADTEGSVDGGPIDNDHAVLFPVIQTPDYDKYASPNRIKEVLGVGKTYAFALNGIKYYENGELKEGGDGIVGVTENGNLTLNSKKLRELVGNSELKGQYPKIVAKYLGMGYTVYDEKVIVFFDGEEPLSTFSDLYTLEAMYLYMTDAPESEIQNAFIDLPSRVSNDVNNTIFYTCPDINLGIQTSMYYAQMGQVNGLATAPALVAGEGKHDSNYTTVRVFNNQNVCTTQFLAFDATVKGGVQVAAAKVGDEVLIATAPYADHNGANGDIRVFDTFGMIRMTVAVRDAIPGPHTIVTGHFIQGMEDEVLLVASQTTNENGELVYAMISLGNGDVISKHTLDCSFALTENTADVPVALSVRNNAEGTDSVILYFNSVQAVYEGDAQNAKFDHAGITLPDDAVSVSASTAEGQKYVAALSARKGEENLSYAMIYGGDSAEGTLVDMGFKENRFYSTMAPSYNDDRYISKGEFCHIRTDMTNKAFYGLADKMSRQVDEWFETTPYEDYAFESTSYYVNRLSTDYLMLEPCFTHRWSKGTAVGALYNYTDLDGASKFISLLPNGATTTYEEMGRDSIIGTYADGILELDKHRYFSLREFLQATCVAFRGENGQPEHLVGISPVHEQEICVGDSVGDYNEYMIKGFRLYLLERYGSLENINAKFETTFTTVQEIDAPRNGALGNRGKWDRYRGDYFEEWTLYNRNMVSKVIMEAYREALLAGYPPESISAHQIPEGEAVAGFLNQANTRLTPIDVVLTCGTAYGGTRYGLLSPTNNIAYNAQLAGHNNITLGEYHAYTTDKNKSFENLLMLWGQGVRMVHHCVGGFEQGVADAEQYAINKLIETNNVARGGYTGGTLNSVSANIGGKIYNIIQIGSSENVGLLKSVDAEGTWEGTVYVVPFHSKVNVTALDDLGTPVAGTSNTFTTGILGEIKNADQAEITFCAAKTGEGRAWVTVEVYQDGCRLDKSITTYELTDIMTPYRFVLWNQIYDDDLEIKVTFHTEEGDGSMDRIHLEGMSGTLQTEMIGFSFYDGAEANQKSRAHIGGVSFDLLDR